MDFLYALESIRCPFLDAIFSAITYLGGEAVFMAVAIIVFWCVDKKHGYFILTAGFLSTVISQFLKLLFRVPRPWIRDPEFTIVESARADAGGYSFPSGHTQNAVSTFGGIVTFAKSKLIRGICIAVIILVAFSRMYLGVHTPADVGVALLLGIMVLLIVNFLFRKFGQKPGFMYILISSMFLLSALYTLFAELYPFPYALADMVNITEGIKNGYTLCGACLGMLVAYHIDSKYIHFSEKAPIPAQILKTVLGLAIVICIKTFLKAPLYSLFGGLFIADTVRYFIIVIFAACLWPMTFPIFKKVFEKRR